MEKLNLTFKSGDVLKATTMQKINDKIDEIVDTSGSGGGITVVKSKEELDALNKPNGEIANIYESLHVNTYGFSDIPEIPFSLINKHRIPDEMLLMLLENGLKGRIQINIDGYIPPKNIDTSANVYEYRLLFMDEAGNTSQYIFTILDKLLIIFGTESYYDLVLYTDQLGKLNVEEALKFNESHKGIYRIVKCAYQNGKRAPKDNDALFYNLFNFESIETPKESISVNVKQSDGWKEAYKINNDNILNQVEKKLIGTKSSTVFMSHDFVNTEIANLCNGEIFNLTKPVDLSGHIFENVAVGMFSHAEGFITQAHGICAHVEGNLNEAIGEGSHAEGERTEASGKNSHSEGYYTETHGDNSHSEGESTRAYGKNSHAGGAYTTAGNFAQTSLGQYNTYDSTPSSDAFVADKPLLVVGNGTSGGRESDAFTIKGNGETYVAGKLLNPAADYAEMFEWEDGNPLETDRVGCLVELIGDKIKLADETSTNIIGVVSGNPAVLGDSPQFWHNKYITDEWGRVQYEDVEVEYKNLEIDPKTCKYKEVTKTRVDHIMAINKDFDDTQTYVDRRDRKEWDAIGLLGKLLVKQDGTLTVGSHCKSGKNGVATKSDSGFYVMKVISDKQALILIK